MTLEPHTDRIDADEALDLPRHARGVTVESDGDGYVVHYLAPTEEATDRTSLTEHFLPYSSPVPDHGSGDEMDPEDGYRVEK